MTDKPTTKYSKAKLFSAIGLPMADVGWISSETR